MEFTVNKETSTVNVKCEYDARQSDVWAAWTEPELLDQWWAPKPFKSKTKSMDFKVGGRRLYAMVGPNGEEHWALADYTAITPKTNIKLLDGFCDNQGNINPAMPRSNWNVDFTESNGSTKVQIQIKHGSPADLEMHISMGFQEGFAATLEQLAEVLKTMNKK